MSSYPHSVPSLPAFCPLPAHLSARRARVHGDVRTSILGLVTESPSCPDGDRRLLLQALSRPVYVLVGRAQPSSSGRLVSAFLAESMASTSTSFCDISTSRGLRGAVAQREGGGACEGWGEVESGTRTRARHFVCFERLDQELYGAHSATGVGVGVT